jgi:hypothetical protein
MAGIADIRAAQKPADYPLTFSRGDSVEVTFQVRDGRGRAVDLAGLTVTALAKPSWEYPVTYALTATITDPLAGLIAVSWAPSVGALLPSLGVWSLTLADGLTWQKTLVTGSLTESRDGLAYCGPCAERGSCQTPCSC